MKFKYDVDDLITRYPALEVCRDSIQQAFLMLKDSYYSGGKLLVAGNGGSCADSEHIVGELMKGFKSNRELSDDFKKTLIAIDPIKGEELSKKLQGALPAIALDGHQGLNTAFTNDVEGGGLLTYAQQVMGYGKNNDVFLGISTSGNAKNVIYAAITAKAKGMKVIALVGKDGGALAKLADVAIIAPSNETFMIQEYHLPIYHCLCLMLEEEFFDWAAETQKLESMSL